MNTILTICENHESFRGLLSEFSNKDCVSRSQSWTKTGNDSVAASSEANIETPVNKIMDGSGPNSSSSVDSAKTIVIESDR